METLLFAPDAALTQLVAYCGSYVGVGLGLSLAVWMIGYVVWFIIDFARGVI